MAHIQYQGHGPPPRRARLARMSFRRVMADERGFLGFIGGAISAVAGVAKQVAGAVSKGAKVAANVSGAAGDSTRFLEAQQLFNRAVAGDSAAAGQLQANAASWPTDASRQYAANLANQLRELQTTKRRNQLLALGAGVVVIGGVAYVSARKKG